MGAPAKDVDGPAALPEHLEGFQAIGLLLDRVALFVQGTAEALKPGRNQLAEAVESLGVDRQGTKVELGRPCGLCSHVMLQESTVRR